MSHPSEPNLYRQATDIEAILALARHCAQRTFLDVGAEKGGFARALFELGFKGTLFEPFPDHQPALRELVAAHDSKLIMCAVDDSDHAGTLHIATGDDGAPLDYFHSLQKLDEHAAVTHSKELTIQCRSLGSLAKEGAIPQRVGILKIDTEGNDLKVVQGMGDLRADVMVCEFITPSLYKGWTTAGPEGLIEAARTKGFEECIAIKRHGAHELMSLRASGFMDGEWGNLIFTSTALLRSAERELEAIALASEQRLFSAFDEMDAAVAALREKARIEAGKMAELKEKLHLAREKIKELKEKGSENWFQRKLRKLRT
jgi:FkbM family methyltransferase